MSLVPEYEILCATVREFYADTTGVAEVVNAATRFVKAQEVYDTRTPEAVRDADTRTCVARPGDLLVWVAGPTDAFVFGDGAELEPLPSRRELAIWQLLLREALAKVNRAALEAEGESR